MKIALVTAMIGACALLPACAVKSPSPSQKLIATPPSVLSERVPAGTVPSSGRVMPGEKHRSSRSFQIVVDPPSAQRFYSFVNFEVRQDGRHNDDIRCDIKIERNNWRDSMFYRGLRGYLSSSPLPWGKKLYFADPTGTGGKDFTVDISLTLKKRPSPLAEAPPFNKAQLRVIRSD